MPNKTIVLVLMVVAALLVLAACNGDGEDDGEGTPAPTTEATPSVAASPPSELCPRIDDEVIQAMVALLELDTQRYEQGEPIEMTLRLINCASQPITRTYPDAQRYDFSAKAEGGDEVWRWSDDVPFAEVLGEETYQPGEQLTFAETWDQLGSDGQAVALGQYELTAEDVGCDESLQNCGSRGVLFIEITAP
jgi:surface antigen